MRAYSHCFLPSDGLHVRIDSQGDPQRAYVTLVEHQFSGSLTSTVVVPAGFRTDLASIPAWLLWLFPRQGHERAALFHDWLYLRQNCLRWEADAMFRAILQFDHVARWRVLLLFYAVRFFGGRTWQKNQAAKKRSLEGSGPR